MVSHFRQRPSRHYLTVAVCQASHERASPTPQAQPSDRKTHDCPGGPASPPARNSVAFLCNRSYPCKLQLSPGASGRDASQQLGALLPSTQCYAPAVCKAKGCTTSSHQRVDAGAAGPAVPRAL